MKKRIFLPKESKKRILLSFIIGVLFTTIGFLISQGTLTGGTCEALCFLGKCVFPRHACTNADLMFWEIYSFIIGITCLILALVSFLRTRSK